MKCFVFKQKRRIGGKIVVSACYSGRYRLAGEFQDTTVRLEVSDKQAAESKLRKLVQELEREGEGLIRPRSCAMDCRCSSPRWWRSTWQN